LDEIEKDVVQRGIGYIRIDGSVKDKVRHDLVQKF